jgi:flavin-dependent dehydrogenase
MTVTLFTDADIVKEQQLQKPGNWNRLLAETKHIQKRTQNAFSYTVPWVRNAFSQITDVSARDNFLAVGDAAIAFDPISSMGIGFAISSACNAARAVNQSLCGDSSYLKIYQDDITGIFRDYLELRKRYYAAEQRWPESLFWQRRN